MQLRVARLCLDCEELHTSNSCPRCASGAYVFLVSWLPVEERRRWRRPPPTARPESAWAHGPHGVVRALVRWLRGDAPPMATPGPATRAADLAAQMNFDGKDETRAVRPEIAFGETKPGTPKV